MPVVMLHGDAIGTDPFDSDGSDSDDSSASLEAGAPCAPPPTKVPRTSAGFSQRPICDIRAAMNTGTTRDEGRARATRKQYDSETKRFLE